MPEKENPGKVRHIFGQSRSWASLLPRSLSRKSLSSEKNGRIYKLLLLVSLSLAITLILTPRTNRPLRQYKVGDIAQEDIKAIGTFLVEDVEITAQRQRELLAQMPPVFDLDEQSATKVQGRLHQALEFMRRKQQELSQPPGSRGGQNDNQKNARLRPSVIYKALMEQKHDFDNLLGTTIPTSTFQLLAKSEFSP